MQHTETMGHVVHTTIHASNSWRIYSNFKLEQTEIRQPYRSKFNKANNFMDKHNKKTHSHTPIHRLRFHLTGGYFQQYSEW